MFTQTIIVRGGSEARDAAYDVLVQIAESVVTDVLVVKAGGHQRTVHQGTEEVFQYLVQSAYKDVIPLLRDAGVQCDPFTKNVW